MAAALGEVRERERREKLAAEKGETKLRGQHKAAAAVSAKRSRDPLSAQGAGPAPAKPAKPRAVRGTAVYAHRDADKRRAYLREYMRKRRAEKVKINAV